LAPPLRVTDGHSLLRPTDHHRLFDANGSIFNVLE